MNEKLKLILKTLSESKPKGKEWEIVVIEEGTSLNGRHYSKELLLKECLKFEGAKIALYQYGDQFNHLPDSARDLETGFPKSVVGWLKDPRVTKIGESKYAIVANAVIADTHEWLSSLLHEAWEDGVRDLMGFSIDATGKGEVREENGKKVFHVTEIDQVLELTIVTNPAAGGKLKRLVAGLDKSKENPMFQKMRDQLVAFIVSVNPGKQEALKEASYDSVMECLIELLNIWGPMGFGDKIKKLIDAVKADGAITEALTEAIEAQTKLKEAAASLLQQKPNEGKTEGKEKGGDKVTPEELKAIQESLAAQAKKTEEMTGLYLSTLLNNKLLESKLPAATQEKIRKELEGKTFTEADLDGKIKLEREYAAKIVEAVHPGGITAVGSVQTGANSRDRISESLEATIKGEPIKNKAGETVEPFRGLHEAYYKFTKHTDPFSAKFKDDLWHEIQVGMGMRKLKGDRISEAITTTQFGEIFGDTLHRRMVAEYIDEGLEDWRKVCTVGPAVKDFRAQRVDRMGGYGVNFSTVAENGTYTSFTSPTDEEASYSVTKKGHLETITMEAVKNDDLRALRLIPVRMGRGAKNTLYQFVFDFFRLNAAVSYDGVAYFHATHANLYTAALSNDNLNLMQIGMYDQAGYNEANNFIRPKIKYLLVPNELDMLAWQIANSNTQVGSLFNNTIPNYFLKHAMEVIMVPYWTDANDFVALADPRLVPSIEIGFLEGNEMPEILQEVANTGSDFTNDATRLKIRHIYGGAVIEHRGAAKAVVP